MGKAKASVALVVVGAGALLAGGVGLMGSAGASDQGPKDRYFAGKIRGKQNSVVLVHYRPREIVQVAYRTRTKRSVNGRKDHRKLFAEDRGISVKDGRFKSKRRLSPGTDDRFLSVSVFRGELQTGFVRVALRYRVRYKLGKGKIERRSTGLHRARLKPVTRSTYERKMSALPFEPR